MENKSPDKTPGDTSPEKANKAPRKRVLPDRFKTPTGQPLTIHRKVFCKLLVETSDSTYAAIQAGYTGPNPEQYGHTLKYQLKHVWEPMIADRLESMQIKALKVLEDTMESGPPHLALAAAKDVMDRGANVRGTRIETGPHDGLTETQLIQKITKALDGNVDQARLLFPDLFPPELIELNPKPIDIN